MPPTIDDFIDNEGKKPLWSLRYDDASAAFIEFVIEPVTVECFICQQVLEIYAVDEWRHADSVVAISGQQNKADKIAQCVSQG